jgi:hypothetical protein
VREPQVASEVRRRFRRFLRTFTDEHGEPIYKKRLEEMIKSGGPGRRRSLLRLRLCCAVAQHAAVAGVAGDGCV